VDFVLKIYKKNSRGRDPRTPAGRGDICLHPPRSPLVRYRCPSASSRLATALLSVRHVVVLYLNQGTCHRIFLPSGRSTYRFFGSHCRYKIPTGQWLF